MSVWADDRDRARDCHEETAQKLHSYIHLHAVAESRCAELVKVLERIANPDELASDPSNFGEFAKAYLNFAQYAARAALAKQESDQ